MRAWAPGYEVVVPATLQAALVAYAHDPELLPLAGGTDLMVLIESGQLAPGRLLSLWHLDELRGLEVSDDAVTLGALTTYATIRDHAAMRAEFPMLVQAARHTGAVAIQNRGTLGGNIANASPAADSPPALLAYDAEVELAAARGAPRWVRYADFHTGYKQTARRPGELITRIRLPRRADPSAWVHRYDKVGTRKFQAISKVCFAGTARVVDGVIRDARIGLGAVGPTVLAAANTQAALEGQAPNAALEAAAAAAMRADVTPIDDIRSTARYRAQVSANLAAAFVRALAAHDHG